MIVLKDGTTAPIERRHSTTLTRKSDERVEVTPDAKPPPRVVRVSHHCKLQPQEETVISVVIKESGTFLLEASQKIYNKHTCSITNGIVTAEENRPFLIKIANFSNNVVALKKGQIVGTASAAPLIAYAMPFEDTPGRLENLYTGKTVHKKDLHVNPNPHVYTAKPCLLRHLTGHLCDGTCQMPDEGEGDNVFNIPDDPEYNKNDTKIHNSCSCCHNKRPDNFTFNINNNNKILNRTSENIKNKNEKNNKNQYRQKICIYTHHFR